MSLKAALLSKHADAPPLNRTSITADPECAMAELQPPTTSERVYPVISGCIEDGHSPSWSELRLLALRIGRESVTHDRKWTIAEHRRLIRMAKLATSGAKSQLDHVPLDHVPPASNPRLDGAGRENGAG